jgi:hypothetical protein
VRAPTSIITALTEAMNFSLAANTWKLYAAVERHVERIRKEMGVRLTFPFSLESIVTFIGYLLDVRKVSGVTVNKYLSGLRMLHITKGHFSPWLRPDVVSSIVTGAKNRDDLAKMMRGKVGELPVTPAMMKTLRLNLKSSNLGRTKKRLIWMTATSGLEWSVQGARDPIQGQGHL